MDLGDAVAALIFGYILFKIFAVFVEGAALKERMEEIREELDQVIRVVKLETINQQLILAYDDENNQFLGQGANKEEIKQRLMERFPNRIFLMDEVPFTANKEYKLPNETSNAR